MTHFASTPLCRSIVGACAFALLASGAGSIGAAEMSMPRIGDKHEYSCTGNNGSKVEILYKAIESDVLLYEASVDGRFKYRLSKPSWLVGTSLYLERMNRHGVSRMVSGLERFDGLNTPTVGASYSGAVVEHRDTGEDTTADVSVKVAEERTFETKATGPLKVYVIESSWKSRDRSFTGTAYVSSDHSALVHWQLKVSDGTEEECDLVAITRS